jgi:thymidylate synthase (FAD)
MKIIEPGFKIQTELDNTSIVERLELCGRVCYKSEEMITDVSAVPFVTRIAAHGHNSVLEMAVVSFKIICHPDHALELLSSQTKYLEIDRIDDGMVVTGSIRAFRELYTLYPHNQLVNDLITVLARKEPSLFENVFEEGKALDRDPQVTISKMTLQDVDNLEPDLKIKHRFVSVKFIVNRAVSHELVRHRPCSFLQESQRYCRYGHDRFDNQVTFIRPRFFKEDSEEYLLWKEAMECTEAKYLKLLETSTPQAARTVLPNSCKTEIIVYCNLKEWQHIFSQRTAQVADPSMREIMVPLQEEMKTMFPIM